jgi:threonine synthase
LNNSNVKYYSTNLRAKKATFREALLKGLAPDGGLYMPVSIPKLSREELERFIGAEYHDIANIILGKYTGNEIDTGVLKRLCREAYNFDIPLEKVSGSRYVLRLDQGPTASFKDFAARMMARLMHHFISRDGRRYTILTATSGDTGSAVANAFHGLDNIEVVVLFPLREVTDIQRRQMTTLGGNIRILAVDGKFDDCQQMVKKAFLDPLLADFAFSSANSINIGRLLPQSVYYFYAWSRLAGSTTDKIIFSIPSGNYGNLMGGIIAREMGLPVAKMIIASNMNNEVPEYLRTGKYRIISPSVNCISSAMNVGHPSNLSRIISLYGGMMNEKGAIIKDPDLGSMRRDFFGASISDSETRKTIADSYRKSGLLLEPHGATAWKSLELYLDVSQPEISGNCFHVSLETAHPAKFSGEIKNILGFSPEAPDSLIQTENRQENYTVLENKYDKLTELLLML